MSFFYALYKFCKTISKFGTAIKITRTSPNLHKYIPHFDSLNLLSY